MKLGRSTQSCPLVLTLVLLPLTLAFEQLACSLFYLTLSIDAFFVMDIIKQFNTGFVDEHGTIHMDRGAIMAHYAKTWLGIDLISSVPVTELLEMMGSSGSSFMRSSKSLKMIRLVRMSKLLKLLRASQLVTKVRNVWIETLEYYKIHISDSTIKLLRLFKLSTVDQIQNDDLWLLIAIGSQLDGSGDQKT